MMRVHHLHSSLLYLPIQLILLSALAPLEFSVSAVEQLIRFELLVQVLALPVLFDLPHVHLVHHPALLGEEQEHKDCESAEVEDNQVFMQQLVVQLMAYGVHLESGSSID